jgi:hypothetical protein
MHKPFGVYGTRGHDGSMFRPNEGSQMTTVPLSTRMECKETHSYPEVAKSTEKTIDFISKLWTF